jgi:hypothetical protein
MWKYTKVDLKLGIKSCDIKYLRGQNLQEIFIESKYKIQDIYLVRPTLPFYNLRVFVESKTYLTLFCGWSGDDGADRCYRFLAQFPP